MIENGNRVQYIGNASPAYSKLGKGFGQEGKVGKVISDWYSLSTVPNAFFVDVEWDGEKPRRDDLLNLQPGHVVNVENLKAIG